MKAVTCASRGGKTVEQFSNAVVVWRLAKDPAVDVPGVSRFPSLHAHRHVCRLSVLEFAWKLMNGTKPAWLALVK